jgi:hypothetical protein
MINLQFLYQSKIDIIIIYIQSSNYGTSSGIPGVNTPLTSTQIAVLMGYVMGDGNMQSESKLAKPRTFRLRALQKSEAFLKDVYSHHKLSLWHHIKRGTG